MTHAVLVAESQSSAESSLALTVAKLGYRALSATHGDEAWQILQSEDAPRLILLSWVMPGINGLNLCRRIRKQGSHYSYIVLVSQRDDKDDLIAGLDAGADDCIRAPCDYFELRSRLMAGRRILELQQEREARIVELEQAIGKIKALQGLLPICMDCNMIRDESDHWQRLEGYIEERSGASFSHSLCDACLERRERR